MKALAAEKKTLSMLLYGLQSMMEILKDQIEKIFSIETSKKPEFLQIIQANKILQWLCSMACEAIIKNYGIMSSSLDFD